jgi:site-specific DNA recombinase
VRTLWADLYRDAHDPSERQSCGLYGADGVRCPSKDVNGIFLEEAIWNDIEQFLRNPGEVAELLQQKMAGGAAKRAPEFDRRSLEVALEAKAEERTRVLGLFRKGRIDDAALDSRLDEIAAEEASLRARLELARNPEPEQQAEALASVPTMLEKLREKLDAGITWELKRQLVVVLVDGITIDTVGEGKAIQAVGTCVTSSSVHFIHARTGVHVANAP